MEENITTFLGNMEQHWEQKKTRDRELDKKKRRMGGNKEDSAEPRR